MRRLARKLFLPVSLLIIGAAAAIVPLPFFVESPGGAFPLSERAYINEEATALNGDFLYTTVSLTRAAIWDLVLASLDETTGARRVEQVVPPDVTTRQYFNRQREIFSATAEVAAAVGLRAAGYDIGPDDFDGEGALVTEIVPGSAADGVLIPGDVITAAGGRPVAIADDVRDATAASEGGLLPLTVERDGHQREFVVEPAPVPDVAEDPIIGIVLETLEPRIQLPLEVRVDAGRTGGPSAGLMIALAIFDIVDPVNLADGRQIAGTGTITFDGEVGRVGGIAHKVRAASRRDVDVFVAPASQAEAARTAVPEGHALEVIGVETFDDAVELLRPDR